MCPGLRINITCHVFYLKSFTDGAGFLSVVRRDAGGLKPVLSNEARKRLCGKTTSMRLGDARPWVKTVSLKRV